MTDVVEIAKERHAWLATEFAEVSNFLRMADALLKQNMSKSNTANRPSLSSVSNAAVNGSRLSRCGRSRLCQERT
jgi:hypothetical protein